MQKRVNVLCSLALLCGLLSHSTVVYAQRHGQSSLSPPLSQEQAQALLTHFQKGWDQAKTGDELLKQGDVDGAIREYQNSLRICNSPQIRAKLAKAFAAKGRYNEALQQYRIAIADTPLPDVDIALNMALVLAKMSRFDEAITMYRVGMRLPIQPVKATGALAGTPLTPGYEAFRSRIAASTEPAESSLFDLRFSPSAFDQSLFEAVVRTGLGKARYGWPDAIEEFDKAIHLAANFAPAYLYRGDALKSKGNRAEARAMYEKAAALGRGEVVQKAKEALSR